MVPGVLHPGLPVTPSLFQPRLAVFLIRFSRVPAFNLFQQKSEHFTKSANVTGRRGVSESNPKEIGQPFQSQP